MKPKSPEACDRTTAQAVAMNNNTPTSKPPRHDSGTCAVTWSVWGRQRLLTRAETAESVMFGIHEMESRGHYRAHAYVVMPDQVHLLLTLNGSRPLYDAIVATKAMATRQMRQRAPLRVGKVWHKGYYEHHAWATDDLRARARHLVSHPLRAGLVTRLVDYAWWFAEWAPPPFGRDGAAPVVRPAAETPSPSPSPAVQAAD